MKTLKPFVFSQRSRRLAFASFAAITTSICTATAFAGPRVGNGGGAWICADSTNHETRWLQLVDLFEAKNEYGYPENVSFKSTNIWETYSLIVEKLKRLIPSSDLNPVETAAQLESRIQMLGTQSALTEIDDAFIRVRPDPESCPRGYLYYGQLANFTQDGRLLVDQNKWNLPQFSNLQKAALLVHESIYKTLRDQFSEQTSLRARKMVGILFSNLDENTQAVLLKSVLATPVTLPSEKPATTCHAEIQDTQGRMIDKRDFEILGGIDRATISIAPFEFSVDVDSQSHQPIRIRISDDSPHGRTEHIEFPLATQAEPSGQFELRLRPDAVSNIIAFIRCRMPN